MEISQRRERKTVLQDTVPTKSFCLKSHWAQSDKQQDLAKNDRARAINTDAAFPFSESEVS